MITMEHVCKSYKIAKRNAGFGEACKAFFHREYEVIHALKDVSFTIEDGEMVGYIGPNGAGKSSTIKILSGILTPDRGTVLVDGRVPYKNRIKHVREIGVVFGQRFQLWWDVPYLACCGICTAAIWNGSTGKCISFSSFYIYVGSGTCGNGIILYAGLCIDIFYDFSSGAQNGIYFRGRVFCRGGYSITVFPGKNTKNNGSIAVCVDAKCSS